MVRDYGITSYSLGTNLVYRKDKFPNGGPQSWADFWDVKKFPGGRCLYDRSFSCLAFALLADGVPADKLYPMDVDRAFRKMSEIKPHIKVWWREGSQSQQLIRDGEVDMIAMWSARAIDLIEDNVPLEIVWNGAEIYYANLLVPKGDPNAKAAWQFCNFVAQAKPQADFAMLLPYGPANPDARALMTQPRLRQTPAWPENERIAFKHDAAWIAPRLAQLRERWTQWLTT
jgi:putative spermidine/putrescine transport system substrate-binding protein